MDFEEYLGELKQLRDIDAAQDRKRGERLELTARAAVGRLVAEGAKAGVRVLLLAERADAEFNDGASRSNYAARVSFRVDNADAVRMLYEQATPEQIEEITTLPQGDGVCSVPGSHLEFFKGDYVTITSTATYYSGTRSELARKAVRRGPAEGRS